MERTFTGRCECGGVRFSVEGPLRDVVNCHCLRCRRFTGHHMAATAAPATALTFDADATLRWYSPADDEHVHYGFCSTCGSSLFWRADAHAERISICAGPIEGPTGLRTTQAWWTSQAGDYHELPPIAESFETE